MSIRYVITAKCTDQAAFRDAAERLVAAVRESEPGTLTYTYYLNEDRGDVVIEETYADAAALQAHVDNAGPALGEMLAAIEMRGFVTLGPVPDEARPILEKLGTRVLEPIAALDP